MPLIRIRGLTKLYRMGDSVVRALDGVDLDIEPGEFVAITGASGSGKSTMMHLLGCLDRPTSGIFLLDGRNVSDLSDRELADVRNKKIGFVFQTFNLINRTTALDNVGVPLFYARRANARGPARRALERVRLAHRAHHRPSELSGGERQRVAIARAIVNEPVLLMADEPTGNLDSRTGEEIMKVFHDLNAQGVTIILVTHEYDVAVQARRIVQMRDGKILWDRPTADVVREQGAASIAPQLIHEAFATPSSAGVTAARPAAAFASGAAGVAMAVPAATAVPAGVRPELEPVAIDTAPKLARGATGTFICGVLGPLVAGAAIILGRTIGKTPIVAGSNKPPPTPLMLLMLASLLGLVIALIFGIIAIFRGRGVLRRMHNEPRAWRGVKRVRVGMALGWLMVLSPLYLVVRWIIKIANP